MLHQTVHLPRAFRRPFPDIPTILRVTVGLVWLAGAAWNLLVTTRMEDPYGWLADGSRIAPWRWFFSEVVETNPLVWTVLLVAGEAGLGFLTLGPRQWARIGLAGGALFSAILFSFGTLYTLMMGPYAVLLAWLVRDDANRSLIELRHGRH
jgi:hypothetical protein